MNRHSLPLCVSQRLQMNRGLFILHPSRMRPISSLVGVSPANLLLFLRPRSIGMYFPSRKFHVFNPTSHWSVRLWRPFCYVLESISSTDDPFNIVYPCSFWFVFDAFDAIALHFVMYIGALIGGSRCLCGNCSAYGPTGGTDNMLTIVHHQRLESDALQYLSKKEYALLHYIYRNNCYSFRNFLSEVMGTKFLHFNRIHPDVFVLILKIRISQNTSIYCQYVSWQLVSTIYSYHQANTELY
jgi:hypothetical protein